MRLLKPWTSQPQVPVGINWGNPLARRLRSAVLMLPGGAYDAVTGVLGTGSGFGATSTSGPIPTEYGTAFAFDGTNDYISFGAYRGGIDNTGLTIVCRVKPVVTNTNQRHVVIRVGGVSFQVANFASNQIGAFTAGAALGGNSPTAGTWSTVFAEFAPSTNASVGVYIDKGALQSTSLGTGADTTTAQYNIGAQDGANRFSNAAIQHVFVFDRVLSAAERAAIVDNPWQIFAPRTLILPTGAGAAAASDTGAITAAAGVATTSTITGSSTAASTVSSASGVATASALTGASTAAAAITQADGVATASALAGSSTAAAAFTQADGVATTGTLVGEGLAAGTGAFVAAAGVATTSALAGASTAESAITQAAGSATASTLVGSDAAQVVSYSGGFWWPHQRKRTRREIDEERRKLGILPPEVLEAVAAVKPERRRIKLVELVGKPKAARITNVDLSEAIAISKKRKRQREDELLLLM